jgi:NAD(P)-dependent dehydrogenase (short-subunit alcohol dehydrogenase family)
VITGGNRGLGLAIAGAFVDAGASVMLCARSGPELDIAVERLVPRASESQTVCGHRCDVASEREVQEMAERAFGEFGHIDIVVNNAGVYGPMGPIEDVDWSEWVNAHDINLFGSVLVCRAFLRHLKANRYGKIIQLSGGGATAPLPRISAYASSKAAVVRFAETLAAEVKEYGIDVNSIAPGALNTRLLDEVLEAGPDRVGSNFYARALKQQDSGGTPLERGAALAVFLGSAASDGITGRLLSAVWDPWEMLESHRADLEASDIYTLRRIVPADRGVSWDPP